MCSDDLLVMDTPPAIQVKKASRVHFAEVDEQVLPSTHSHSVSAYVRSVVF